MQILKMANLVVLTLLSLASGVAKVMKMPQEVEFFGAAGFSETGLVMFGAAQLAGGILMALPGTRIWGAIVVALTFAVSALLVFMSGKIAFGLFSMVPVVLTAVLIRTSMTNRTPAASS